jgi:glutathione S-transferase|tara:strand:- start:4064 stop:4765 length:702 start_codon:yes stop_codon:yes gene_type:complete
MSAFPILYSFRRCPYAMRARMALAVAAQTCELREIVLRDKPVEMLAISPKGTVPVMQQPDGQVLEESLDVMLWALARQDPESWLCPEEESLPAMLALIDACERDFKAHLDRYKYASRYADADPAAERAAAAVFLHQLEARLVGKDYLFGRRRSLADVALAPFVRQFANTDRAWFETQPWPGLAAWLDAFVSSALFTSVMVKLRPWRAGDCPALFFGAGNGAPRASCQADHPLG